MKRSSKHDGGVRWTRGTQAEVESLIQRKTDLEKMPWNWPQDWSERVTERMGRGKCMEIRDGSRPGGENVMHMSSGPRM